MCEVCVDFLIFFSTLFLSAFLVVDSYVFSVPNIEVSGRPVHTHVRAFHGY